MRFRLRTLVALTAVGPPALAALWFAPSYLPPEALNFAFLLLGAIVVASLLAAAIGILLALRWLSSLIASGLIRLLSSPANWK